MFLLETWFFWIFTYFISKWIKKKGLIEKITKNWKSDVASHNTWREVNVKSAPTLFRELIEANIGENRLF